MCSSIEYPAFPYQYYRHIRTACSSNIIQYKMLKSFLSSVYFAQTHLAEASRQRHCTIPTIKCYKPPCPQGTHAMLRHHWGTAHSQPHPHPSPLLHLEPSADYCFQGLPVTRKLTQGLARAPGMLLSCCGAAGDALLPLLPAPPPIL